MAFSIPTTDPLVADRAAFFKHAAKPNGLRMAQVGPLANLVRRWQEEAQQFKETNPTRARHAMSYAIAVAMETRAW